MQRIKTLFLNKEQSKEIISYNYDMEDAVFRIIPYEDGEIIEEADCCQGLDYAIPTYSLQEMLAKFPTSIKEGEFTILPFENKIGYAMWEGSEMYGWCDDFEFEFSVDGAYELFVTLLQKRYM